MPMPTWPRGTSVLMSAVTDGKSPARGSDVRSRRKCVVGVGETITVANASVHLRLRISYPLPSVRRNSSQRTGSASASAIVRPRMRLVSEYVSRLVSWMSSRGGVHCGNLSLFHPEIAVSFDSYTISLHDAPPLHSATVSSPRVSP